MTFTLFDRAKALEPNPFAYGLRPMEVLERWDSARAEELRRHIEAMLQAYPREHRDVMWNRCDGKNATQGNDAFFELFVHHLFVSRGYTCIGLEEPLTNSTYSIDFTFRAPAGTEFLVEVVSHNKPKQLDGPSKLMAGLFSAIDTIVAPFHEVEVSRCWGSMATAVSNRSVMSWVSQWLATLPKPGCAAAEEPLPRHDFLLTPTCGFTLAPRFRRPGAGNAGLVAAIHVTSAQADVIDGIRRKLHQKAFKYGRLRLPMVLALNVSPDLVAADGVFEHAMFGAERPRTVTEEPYTGHPNAYVPTSGALVEAGGPMSHIPAVLGFVGVNPLSCAPGLEEAGYLGQVYHSKHTPRLDLTALGLPQKYPEAFLPGRIDRLRYPRRRYPCVSRQAPRLSAGPALVLSRAA